MATLTAEAQEQLNEIESLTGSFGPDGFPDPEAEPAVAAARLAASKAAEQRAAVAAEIEKLETSLGVPPRTPVRDLERLSVKLLAAGKSEDDAQSLCSLHDRLKRLKAAQEMADLRAQEAVDRARRVLSARAAEVEFAPAARAEALALLKLIEARRNTNAARRRLQAAGFDQPGGTFNDFGLLDTWQNRALADLVRLDHLSREEVMAAIPELNAL